MNVVLTAATLNEIAPLQKSLVPVNVLVTGVGSAITAYSLTKYILQYKPDLVIQAGIAGSFTDQLAPGSVAFVDREVLADLGAAETGGFLDIFDLGLAGTNDRPFENKWLINPDMDRWKRYSLPFVSGATVNNISSTPHDVKRLVSKYDPSLESMEGAALHYVCLRENIPFIQLRAISNYCGERDKSRWKLPQSIAALNQHLKIIIEDL